MRSNRAQCDARVGRGRQSGNRRAVFEEDREEVSEALGGSDMVFVTAGMGGGTGTGAAPIVAEIARDAGALTVGIVTTPFKMEGMPRMRNALAGIDALKKAADTAIIIPNQRLLEISSEDTTLRDAFLFADDVLLQATRGISDLITIPGMVNLDFNDVRTVMQSGGDALMGTAEATGENRAVTAAEKALNSPLLDNVSVAGAQGVLVNISASSELKLFEMDKAVNLITDAVGHEANIIWGTVLDDNMKDELRVTVIATGFNKNPSDQVNANGANLAYHPSPAPVAETETPEIDATDADIPAFMRKVDEDADDLDLDLAEKTDKDAASLNDLEYPAFLRRQMQGG